MNSFVALLLLLVYPMMCVNATSNISNVRGIALMKDRAVSHLNLQALTKNMLTYRGISSYF